MMTTIAIIILCLACYWCGFFTCAIFAARKSARDQARAELAEYQRDQLMETIAERTDQAGRKEAGL